MSCIAVSRRCHLVSVNSVVVMSDLIAVSCLLRYALLLWGSLECEDHASERKFFTC